MSKRGYRIPQPKGGQNGGHNWFARSKGSSHYSRFFHPEKSIRPSLGQLPKHPKRSGILVWSNGTYIMAVHGKLKYSKHNY